MTGPGHRVERLADQIRDEVAAMIAGELKDPRIGLATVTRVELSPDLDQARVLVSVLGNGEAQQETLEGLFSAASYVRQALGHRLRIRRPPQVIFTLDHSAEEGLKMERLLRKLKQEQEG